MDYKYQGIILNKKDIAEVDRIYTIYTQEAGKIRVIGKGVRRPNAKLAGNLEPITAAEIFVAKTKGMGKVTGTIPVNVFINIKSDLDLLNRIFYVFRLIERLIPEQEQDERIFNLIFNYLHEMEKQKKESEKKDVLTFGFLFKLLDELGYRLEAGRCVGCESKLFPENNYFSMARGGILCSVCSGQESRKIKVSGETIKLIRIFLSNKLENFSKLQVSSADVGCLKAVITELVNWLADSPRAFDNLARI